MTSETPQRKRQRYERVVASCRALFEEESDWIAAMATVACELHHAFEYFHWTGFYRQTAPGQLVIGPYQGTHGCLHISFDRGVCGAAARHARHAIGARRACLPRSYRPAPRRRDPRSSCRCSRPIQRVLAVLDVDSNEPDAFDAIDQHYLEELCGVLGVLFASWLIDGAR